MEYFSTRGSGARISASEAIAQGLAPDGGLFVPAQLPPVTEEALRELLPLGYGARAKRILSMYLPEYSEAELDELVAASYGANFDTAAIERRRASRTRARAILSSGTARLRPSRIWPCKCCRTC